MIRVASLEKIGSGVVESVEQGLFKAYGVGCGPLRSFDVPGNTAPGQKGEMDAVRFLGQVSPRRVTEDDVFLFLTMRKLSPVSVAGRLVPVRSISMEERGVAVVSCAWEEGDECVDDPVAMAVKLSVHEVGHLLGLRHCPDFRCAMHPTWTPEFLQTGRAWLCGFCQKRNSAAYEGADAMVTGGGQDGTASDEGRGEDRDGFEWSSRQG